MITLPVIGSIIGWSPVGDRSRIANRVIPNQTRRSGDLQSPLESGPRCWIRLRSNPWASFRNEKAPAIPHISAGKYDQSAKTQREGQSTLVATTQEGARSVVVWPCGDHCPQQSWS